MNPESQRKFRTTRDIIVPKGSNVVYIGRMKQEVTRLAHAFVKAGPDIYYEFLMNFDDALELGWIEEIEPKL